RPTYDTSLYSYTQSLPFPNTLLFIVTTLYSLIFIFFFFNDPAPTEIYTLSLHDALPIYLWLSLRKLSSFRSLVMLVLYSLRKPSDRKSTRLNSSHSQISYAVFCLKKKKKKRNT